MTNSVRRSRTRAGGATGRRRKLSTSILLLLGLFAGLIGFAPSAFAHHAYIQDTVKNSCDLATGKIKVTFDVNSWDTVTSNERVLNPSIGVQYRLSDTSTFPPIPPVEGFSPDIGTWPFVDNNAGDVPTFSGDFLLDPAVAAGKFIQLRAYPKGDWINADGTSTLAANPDTQQSFVIAHEALTANCPPPNPSATAAVQCGASQIQLSFTGAGSATTVDIKKNGSLVAGGDNVPVPLGGPTVFNVPLVDADEDTTVAITADYAIGTDQTFNLAVDCKHPMPGAQAQVRCAENDILVSLTNTGTQATTADIRKNGVLVGNDVPVPIGSSTFSVGLVAGDENTNVTITVDFAVGVDPAPIVLPVDCQKPAATLTFSCTEGGVVATLTNAGLADTTVLVNGQPVIVPAGGAPVVITVPVAEGATYSVSVTGDDGLDKTISGTRDCEKPAATLAFSCAEGGVVVTVTNTGELPTVVMVNGSPVTVQPGQPYTTTIPVAEGATYTVTVTGDDHLNQTLTGTRDCENPVATVVFDCAQGGVVVTLTNSGELDVTVPVNGEDVVVPAGTTADNPVIRVIGVTEGAAYDITVLGQTATGTRDCEKPAATLAFSCAEGGVVVMVTNGGELPTEVMVNGTPVTVQPGQPYTTTIPVAEGASYTVTVTGDDGLNQMLTGTRDCALPVLESAKLVCAEGGVVVVLTNGGELPATVQVNGADVVIPAQGQMTVTIPVAEDATYSFDVVIDGVATTVAGTRDCEHPAVLSAQLDCAEGGVVVLLTNDGEQATTVVVDGTSVEVPAGAGSSDENPAVKVTVPVAENASFDFTIVGDGIADHEVGTADCKHPKPSVDDEVVCATGGLNVVLRNTGDDTATYDITSPALPGGADTATVEAGGVKSFLIPMAEDTSTDVKVTSAGAVLFDKTITRDCVEVQANPPIVQLPRTGANTTGLLNLAGALLLAGTVLVTVGRRRQSRLMS